MKADSKAIQAIHTHVITHNPRVFVSHSDHTMWHLHIKSVKEEDRGSFVLCTLLKANIKSIKVLSIINYLCMYRVEFTKQTNSRFKLMF